MSIDTLAYAKELKAAGVPDEAAEAHANALNKAVQAGLATKADLDAMEQRIDARMVRYMQVQAVGIVAVMAAITAALIAGLK